MTNKFIPSHETVPTREFSGLQAIRIVEYTRRFSSWCVYVFVALSQEPAKWWPLGCNSVFQRKLLNWPEKEGFVRFPVWILVEKRREIYSHFNLQGGFFSFFWTDLDYSREQVEWIFIRIQFQNFWILEVMSHLFMVIYIFELAIFRFLLLWIKRN